MSEGPITEVVASVLRFDRPSEIFPGTTGSRCSLFDKFVETTEVDSSVDGDVHSSRSAPGVDPHPISRADEEGVGFLAF